MRPVIANAIEIPWSKRLVYWWCFDQACIIVTKLFMPHVRILPQSQIQTVKSSVLTVPVWYIFHRIHLDNYKEKMLFCEWTDKSYWKIFKAYANLQ
jgi:hypothetical protein